MRVITLELGALGTNCYIVHNQWGTLVIDPADDAQRIEKAAAEQGWTVDAVAFTHGHYDHIGAAEELPVDAVHVQEKDELLYLNPEYNLSTHFGAAFFGKKKRVHLRDGEQFMGFEVIHTPGHTPGGICLYSEEEKTLFCGDTLFCSGYGRTDFPGGSMAQLRSSLRKLLALPEDVRAYPGHGASTTIAQERRSLGWQM